mmetsp:Transcript_123927/g.246710  ORF Transcript_123927/g.246710 Transcript_123927/m.246710 type:complete len:290 (-) Transcript_123927:65-934(-)
MTRRRTWPNTLLLRILTVVFIGRVAKRLSGIASTVPLLGGRVVWRLNDWRPDNDNVRGGSSSASLKAATETAGVHFSGSLGEPRPNDEVYAGVALRVNLLPEQLSEVRGLSLDVAESDGMQYAMSLSLRGSTTTHKYNFKAEGEGPIDMLFRDFVPTLRNGRPVPEPHPPLNLSRVEMMSLRAEGGSGQAASPFSLTLRSVSAIPGREVVAVPSARETRWTCPACNMMNLGTSSECTRCGESLAAIAAKEQAKMKAAADAKPSRWTCNDCGARNFPVATECHKCGASKP